MFRKVPKPSWSRNKIEDKKTRLSTFNIRDSSHIALKLVVALNLLVKTIGRQQLGHHTELIQCNVDFPLDASLPHV